MFKCLGASRSFITPFFDGEGAAARYAVLRKDESFDYALVSCIECQSWIPDGFGGCSRKHVYLKHRALIYENSTPRKSRELCPGTSINLSILTQHNLICAWSCMYSRIKAALHLKATYLSTRKEEIPEPVKTAATAARRTPKLHLAEP